MKVDVMDKYLSDQRKRIAEKRDIIAKLEQANRLIDSLTQDKTMLANELQECRNAQKV